MARSRATSRRCRPRSTPVRRPTSRTRRRSARRRCTGRASTATRRVRALLAANAAVDATNSFRQSALQCCTFEGHTKVAEILLAAGADPLHEDLIYGSAIHFAKHEKPRNHAKMHRSSPPPPAAPPTPPPPPPPPPPMAPRRPPRRRRAAPCRRRLVVVRRRLVVVGRRRFGGGARRPRELRDGPSCSTGWRRCASTATLCATRRRARCCGRRCCRCCCACGGAATARVRRSGPTAVRPRRSLLPAAHAPLLQVRARRADTLPHSR